MSPYLARFSVMLAVSLVLPLVACQESSGLVPAQGAGSSSDRVALPEVRREFLAPSGRFAFVVSTKDGWTSPRGTGELFSVGANRMLLWSRELPQQFGPRFALLNDLGTVLMLDEWINVSSKYAVLVVDRDNRQVAQHSTDAVQAILQVPMNQIVQLARHGWWLQAPPVLIPTGGVAVVQAGDKQLAIRLDSGSMSLR